MTSIVSAAVAAVVGALQAATPVAPQIERVRLRALKAGTTTAVVVRPLQAQAEILTLGFNGPSVWTTPIAVECYARVTPGVAADVAVDALASAVYARLMADQTLGGAVVALQPKGLSYDFDSDADTTVCATFIFEARHVAGASVFTN